MKFITVWRYADGAALSSFAGTGDDGKASVLVQSEDDVTLVEAERLRGLVASREPFEATHVSLADAREILGWDVPEA